LSLFFEIARYVPSEMAQGITLPPL